MSERANAVPMAPEQWLDLIIAGAAHRSHDEAHRKLGELLLQRYFVSLPEGYSDDLVARAYFAEVLCVVASGLRGFSIVRDFFQSSWDSLKAGKAREVEWAERLDNFSPFKKGGHWERITAILTSAALGGTLGAAITTMLKSPWWAVFIGLAVFVGLMVAMELIVGRIRCGRLTGLETRFPQELLDSWEDKTLGGYRKVLCQVFPLLVEITNRHYPGSCDKPTDGKPLEELIERHFAFKRRLKDVAAS